MRKPEKKASADSAAIQGVLNLWPKPFLETKKKVRSKYARKGFEQLEDVYRIFQAVLERDELQSAEAKRNIQEFLRYLK